MAENVLLQNMNVGGIWARDRRQIELWWPMVSRCGAGPNSWSTQPWLARYVAKALLIPNADTTDGVQLRTARQRKETKYRELLQSRRCRLVVLALEVGGCWSEEAVTFVRLLAKAKARTEPQLLRPAAQAAYFHRWTGILAMAAQRTFAGGYLA